jgi:hypothetical protein
MSQPLVRPDEKKPMSGEDWTVLSAGLVASGGTEPYDIGSHLIGQDGCPGLIRRIGPELSRPVVPSEGV